MVCDQTCAPDDALLLIFDRAKVEQLTLWGLALGILEHTIRFN